MATDSQRVVVASVAEADIGSIKVGDPVALTFNAYPGKIYTGKVTGLPLMATTSSNVTTYPVNVTVNGPAQELLPGMTANLTIVPARAQNVTVVPTTAVQTSSFGSYVVALNSHNQIVRMLVQTGISDLNNTQILSGLTPGQHIVVPRVSSLASAGGVTGGRRGFGGLGGFGGGRVRAFYGGRLYQNNIDQKLFVAYNPPQSNTGTRAGGTSFGSGCFGGGSSQNAQINAALTVGNPPSSVSSDSGATSSASSGSGATSSTTSQSAASTGQGGAVSAGTRRALSGQLLSISGGSLTVQSFLGQASLPTTAQTHFYQVTTAAATALAVGQRVAIAPNRNDPSTATSVTIAPAGNVFVRVRSFSGGSGGFGSGGSGGGFGSGGFGSGGSGGGFGSGTGGGFGRGAGLAGTIIALGHGTISVKTQQGGSQTVKLTALTAVHRVVAATREGLKASSYVSVGSATVNGRQVAADVVEATVPARQTRWPGGPAPSGCRSHWSAHVVATLVHRRPPVRDFDNAVSSLKELIDAFTTGGLIASDAPAHLRLEVVQTFGRERGVLLDVWPAKVP